MYVAVVLGLGEVVFVVAFVVIVDGGGCSKMHVLYDIFYFKSLKGSKKKEEAVLLYYVLYILIKALVNQGIFSFKCSS